MCEITLRVLDGSNSTLAQDTGKSAVNLVYKGEYREGDRIQLEVSEPGVFLVIQLDDVMNPAFVYMKETSYTLTIPFGEKRVSYNPKTFTGNLHLLKARLATEAEIRCEKNLALNEYDTHENTGCFPHAYANVETRGESVFAARNAINGNVENRSHGEWPFESWGINQNPDAVFTLDFGRPVEVNRVILVTRADFPHDNWWKQADLSFSDGTSMTVTMEKSYAPHVFTFPAKTITWLKLGKLIKDENDPSPFPSLTQIQVYGQEA